MKTRLQKTRPLKDLIESAKVGFASGDAVEHGLAQVRMNNVTTSGGWDFSKVRRLPVDAHSVAESLLKPGDVLFNSTNSPSLVGKSAYFSGFEEPLTFSNHFVRIRTQAGVLNSAYLTRWLNHLFDQRLFEERCIQWVNQATIKREDLLALQVPLPHPTEQERIATILDKADLIRRKRQQAHRVTDDFLRSVFLKMFGDPAAHGWRMLAVTDMLSSQDGAIRTGPFGSQLLHSEFVEEGIAVLGIDNAVNNEFRWGKPRFITEEKYDVLRRYTVRPRDVIITIMGTVGRCAIVPEDIPTAINTKHLCCITLDHGKCLPEFLHAYFLTHPLARKYLSSTAKGAIMDGLNMGIIKAMPVPEVPMHLQEEYRDLVKKHTQMKTRLTSHQAEAETLFASLQQRAFTGEL